MAVKRTFLGWHASPLVRACDALMERGGDLSSLVVVTPGGRVSRLLLGMLVDRAGGRPMSPPRFVTQGEVADVALGGAGTPAGPVQRSSAWERALAMSGRLPSLLPRRGEGESCGGVAAMLERCHEELIGEGLRFGDVPGRSLGMVDDREAARWSEAARVQAVYEEELGAAGLVDVGLARLRLLEEGGPATRAKIVLVGVPDLNGVARRALMHPALEVEAMIAAPEELAGLFDELGVIDVERWKSREIPLREESLVFADGPAEQAGCAMEAIAKLEGRYAVHEVAIGSPDATVAPHLERAARRYAGVTARPAAGSPLRSSSVARLLRSMAALLEEGSYAALAALVRHPDMERYLLRSSAGSRMEQWLGPMDEYATRRLPTSITQKQGAAPADSGSEAPAGPLNDVVNRVLRLLRPLTEPRPHPNHLLAAMQQVYAGNRVPREDPSAAEAVKACEEIQRAVAQCAALPRSWHPETGAALIRLVMDTIGDSPLPAEASADSLELLGWLELPLDPSPVAIITGVNDGILPESYGADALLPDGLRTRLGIACSDRRLARDVFLMSLVANSHEHVTLISGRRNGEGEPLLPSRLLFAADADTVVGRVRRLCKERSPVPRVRMLEMPGGIDRFPEMPRVNVAPVESMPVTAFRTYLQSPYLFYLTHVLKLEEVERPAPEMDPKNFGVLLHEALDAFGKSDAKESPDERKVRDCLLDHLSALGLEWFGSSPSLAVRVQLEVARARLEEVAAWQSKRRAAGWHIVQTEWKPTGGVELPGMAKPFRVRGKIDRVDRHEELGAAILDYKTGESADPPRKTHGKPGNWKDLQLPLYRHLAAGLNLPPEKLVLGYVAVPSLPGGVKLLEGNWAEAELADADATAREIAEKVRRGEFFELGTRPAEKGTLAALSGTAFVAARQPGEAVDSE